MWTRTHTMSSDTQSESELMVLNIGGTRFETFRSTLEKWPHSRLARLDTTSPNYRPDRGDYFFDRDPNMFTYIMDFYRNDTLHFAHNLCDSVVRRELHYWDIDEENVSPCCWGFVTQHGEHRATDDLLCEALDLDDIYALSKDKPMWQRSIAPWWTFLDDSASSDGALYYSYWIGVALLISVFNIICCHWDPFRVPAKFPRIHFNATNNPKLMRFETTDPHPVLVVIDMALTGFFLLEFIVKACVCPNMHTFFENYLNVIEIFAVFPKAAVLILRYGVPDLASHRELYLAYYFLSMFDVFRVARLFNFGKHYVGLRILMVTMQASASETFFLVFLMFVGAVLFGVAIYHCEIRSLHTMPDMHTGAYWAFNTMTTVGYGDVVPETFQGRGLAILCSLLGLLITGLAIPIIANSFDRYYSQARLMLMRQRLGCPIDPMYPIDDVDKQHIARVLSESILGVNLADFRLQHQ